MGWRRGLVRGERTTGLIGSRGGVRREEGGTRCKEGTSRTAEDVIDISK